MIGDEWSTCFATSLSNDENQSGDDENTDREQTNQRHCYILHLQRVCFCHVTAAQF